MALADLFHELPTDDDLIVVIKRLSEPEIPEEQKSYWQDQADVYNAERSFSKKQDILTAEQYMLLQAHKEFRVIGFTSGLFEFKIPEEQRAYWEKRASAYNDERMLPADSGLTAEQYVLLQAQRESDERIPVLLELEKKQDDQRTETPADP